jgi:hypothetical protein
MCSRTTKLPRYGKSPIPSSSYMTVGKCAVMVRGSIKASAFPLMQANAGRSIRSSYRRTAPTQKAGTSAYHGLGTRCTCTRATRQRAPIGNATRRALVSVGGCPSYAKVETPVQSWNDARSVGGAPNGYSSRDGNGTLDPYRRVSLLSKTQKREAERHDGDASATVQRRSQYDTLLVMPFFNRNNQRLC